MPVVAVVLLMISLALAFAAVLTKTDLANDSVLLLAIGGSFLAGPVVLKYGLFIQTVVDFLIIAFAIFLLVKAINQAREVFEDRREREEQAKRPVQAPEEVLLLREIRDALQSES